MMASSNIHDQYDAYRRSRSANPSPSPRIDQSSTMPTTSRLSVAGKDENKISAEIFNPSWYQLSTPDNSNSRLLSVKVKFLVTFSRAFLSRYLGGSMYPAFPIVKFNSKHVCHLPVYYVGMLDWSPQFPQSAGKSGSLLLLGSSVKEPIVPWSSGQPSLVDSDGEQKPINCFVKRDATEYEYVGEYAFRPGFKKLTQEEVIKHVTKAAWNNWVEGISKSKWGTKFLWELEVVKSEPGKGDTDIKFSPEVIMRLFESSDTDSARLCFYWQDIECVGYNRVMYDALCKKGAEIGWTTRESSVLKESE